MSEKVLIYLGPTLSRTEALGIVPEAIIRPPAKQSDIISDIVQFQPTHLILIDGEFSQNLSVWIKELWLTTIINPL